MAALELFHRLAEDASAAARRRVLALGLEARVAFRNVGFDSHREALAAHGGGATPALWDGARLHVGLDAVLAALERIAAAPPRPKGAGRRGGSPPSTRPSRRRAPR